MFKFVEKVKHDLHLEIAHQVQEEIHDLRRSLIKTEQYTTLRDVQRWRTLVDEHLELVKKKNAQSNLERRFISKVQGLQGCCANTEGRE